MKQKVLFYVMLLASMTLAAQVRNPFEMATNNEDEVVHLEQWQQHAAKPLQTIVKLQDYSEYTIDLKGAKNGRTLCPAIQQVLEGYVIESIEQLCPTFVMPKEPRRSPSYGGGEVRDHDLSQMYLITLSEESPKREYELIEELSALDEVEFAEPNYLVFALGSPDMQDLGNPGNVADATYCASAKTVDASVPDINMNGRKTGGIFTPNDPMYSLQWGIPACGIDSLLTAPKRDSTWRPVICILDTGVDPDHPDLQGNIWTNTAEQNGAANQDDDNNGFRDDIHGWDFVNQTGDIHDFNSHGTHCAGIAGAVTNNGIGIAGACPDALIMPVCVMQSDGTGDIATIVQGINYARQNGADVVSMSIGTYAYSIAMEQALAVAYQNAVLVAAAGNDALFIDCRCGSPCGTMFPGAFTFVFGVQATHPGGGLAGFSNIDCDGPSYSQFDEEKLYNYELSAPGVGIMSTVPNGQYRSYNGTSMACPLVAGGIGSLLQRREYLTKEILFGDLINYSQEFMPVDFWAAYNADSISPAMFQCVAIEINDTAYGDSSMYADAGERLQLYPTIRTVWGPADSVEIWLEFQEFEDTGTIQILQNHVLLGHPISSYAKAKSVNPIDIQIANNVVDGRHICLTMCATAPNATDTLRHDFVLSVTNGIKLHGMLTHNDTLWPNVQYIVTDNYAIVEGAELVIKPGVVIKIKDGVTISNAGKIYAVGTPDSMITFTKTDLGSSWKSMALSKYDTLDYCIFEWADPINSSVSFLGGSSRTYIPSSAYSLTDLNNYIKVLPLSLPVISNTLFVNCNHLSLSNDCFIRKSVITQNNIYSIGGLNSLSISGRECAPMVYSIGNTYHNYYCGSDSLHVSYNNIVNNIGNLGISIEKEPDISELWPCGINCFSNGYISVSSSTIQFVSPRSLYYGTSKENTARQKIRDFLYPNSGSFGYLDLTYMESRPNCEAHGIVWKVEVNGYDAQDEFDSIIPLGVGTHEFKVYFNRAMDTSITPMVAMGVRPPYTQTAISENASWSADSTIYTAHLTLTGRSAIDGLNRIYVSGAQDNENFEIPYENQRFNVYVASSGSMSAGFQATPGIGKVDLEWNDQEVNYDDFLGFNIYRYNYDSLLTNRHYVSGVGYVYDTVWGPTDTLRLNQTLVQDTMFTDYDVVPGTRYYYFYKILSTSLTENSPSKTVSCVPNSTIPGDANGSYAVDVADVISVINYVTGQNPQPFLFEAADVNGDGVINVLDIVSIINIILHPNQQQPNAKTQYTAIYTLENDTLYINTPVALAGLQFTLGGCLRSDIEVLPALTGFECANVEEDGNLTMLFYSMSGATVPAGKTALLRIQNANSEIQSIVLSDSQGQNVIAMNGDAVGITDIETIQAQFATAYPNPFSDKVRLEMTVGNYSRINLVFTDLMGRTVDRREVSTPTAGRYSLMWNATGLPRGIYFATLYADGQKAQTIKLVVK